MSTERKWVDFVYEKLTVGERQHLVNKIYKHDGIYPQKLKEAVEGKTGEESQFRVGDVVTGRAGNRYAITTDGWTGVVTAVNGRHMFVKGQSSAGTLHTYNVLQSEFDPVVCQGEAA